MKDGKQLTVVIKLGTSSIVDERSHEPLLSTLSLIVETAVKLRNEGHRVIIVSSGAIGVGLRRMDVETRPMYLPRVQALAAVGQCRLMSLWDSLFGHLRQPVAQILLTRNDIANTTQYRNAQNTLGELLSMGVIPIVNENDTLAVAEIKFGDNDTLSAITAAMIQADYLFLMTDVDCLYDKNPREHRDAQAIRVVEDITSLIVNVSTAGSSLGTGGMSTKLVAARLATSAGVTTIITRSSNPGSIREIIHQETHYNNNGNVSPSSSPLHTRFLPHAHPMQDRSFWLLHSISPHGKLYISQEAYLSLSSDRQQSGGHAAGLLPYMIQQVEGSFEQQEAVRLMLLTWEATAEQEVGRALVNYNATEIRSIMGMQNTGIERVLGYADSEYVAVRENISFFT